MSSSRRQTWTERKVNSRVVAELSRRTNVMQGTLRRCGSLDASQVIAMYYIWPYPKERSTNNQLTPFLGQYTCPVHIYLVCSRPSTCGTHRFLS